MGTGVSQQQLAKVSKLNKRVPYFKARSQFK